MRLTGYMTRRLAVALVCFGAAHVLVDERLAGPIRSAIVSLGEAAGQRVAYISVLVVGPDGPFLGEGSGTRVWNLAWRNAPWAAAAAAGWTAAMLAYAACASPRLLGRSRLFAYRGPTRCGGCGYVLTGLREMRCPECGRGI